MRPQNRFDLISDQIITLYIAIVFTVMVIQMLRRGREMDKLAFALVALFTTLAVAYFGVAAVQFHIIKELAAWFIWSLKITIAIFGTGVITQLAIDERRRRRENRLHG